MAGLLVMILLYVVLLPLSFFSSFLVNASTTALGRILPPSMTGFLVQAAAALTSIVALFVLFLAIYVVVPNIPVMRTVFAHRPRKIRSYSVFSRAAILSGSCHWFT